MQQWLMCFNSSKYHFDFQSLLTRTVSSISLSQCNAITINAGFNNKWSCLRRGLTRGESKNSAKIKCRQNVRNDNLSLFFFHSGWMCRCQSLQGISINSIDFQSVGLALAFIDC